MKDYSLQKSTLIKNDDTAASVGKNDQSTVATPPQEDGDTVHIKGGRSNYQSTHIKALAETEEREQLPEED